MVVSESFLAFIDTLHMLLEIIQGFQPEGHSMEVDNVDIGAIMVTDNLVTSHTILDMHSSIAIAQHDASIMSHHVLVSQVIFPWNSGL